MSNFLNGVFTPRYTWSSVTGFETRLDTSLAGNTTIGDSTTNYSLLLNGLPIVAGGGVASVGAGTNIYIANPAIPVVNVSVSTTLDLHNNDLSGIISFNGVGAKFNSNSNLIAIGNGAASGNTGSYVNAFGCNAGQSNTGSNVNAIGYNAANGNTGYNVDAIGYQAAFGNSGSAVLAIGINAAYGNSGNYVNAIGYTAGESNTGNNCTFIGKMPIGAAFNTLNNRLIVYSTNSNNPLLYGDTSNMSLGIGTSTLTSAALTVSGKISATGILDTGNSTGTANQVLTAGTGGGGLVWASSSVGGVASVTAGTGISVGGTITNPSVAIADVGSAGIYAYPSSVTTNAQGQVISITAGSNYPYIWQYTKAVIQHLSSDVGGAGTYITWDTTIYEQPGYTSALTPASDAFIVPLTGWYQITFVGLLGGAAESGSGTGYVPQGGGNNNIPKGTVSQFTYGIRLNNTPVPGWQGYLNGYVVGEVEGVQTQLVVIYKLNSNSQIVVDNETLAVGGLGDFTAINGTMLTITYLRP